MKSRKIDASGTVQKPVLLGTIALLLLIIVGGAVYFWSTETGGETLKIELFSPVNEVSQTTNFTIVFSRELAGDSLLNMPTAISPCGFDPKIPGRFEWIARDKVRFYPDVQLLPSTEYRAEINSKFASEFGYALRGNRRFNFYTERFRVASATLNYNLTPESDQRADLAASIEFNYRVDPLEAMKHINLQYEDGGKIPFEIVTSAVSTYIGLVAHDALRGPEEKQIQLKISKGLLCDGGSLGLQDDHITPLGLPGRTELRVESVLPLHTDIADKAIRVQFNLPINTQTASSFVSIEPPIAFKITAGHTHLDLRASFDPQKTYQVKISRGIRAIDGSELRRDFSGAVTLLNANIEPQVDFVGGGFYLTRSGNLNVGISTINVDKVVLEIEEVFANNLPYLLSTNDLGEAGRHYDWVYNMEAMGRTVHEEQISIANRPNDEVITPLNMKSYLDAERHGIYRVSARVSDRRWNMASKWVVATDLGMLVKKSGDELMVWVNSLSTLDPVANAALTLMSRNNQNLGEARTNGDGLAVFKNYDSSGDGLEPYLVTAMAGKDMSFVEITRRLIATTDFDVAGAAFLAGGLEGFVYFERDIYRPGETAHIAAIVRGPNAAVPESFPLRIIVTGPDEKILTEQRKTPNEQGAFEISLPIPDYALTGRYNVSLLIGEEEEIGHGRFSVEEFIPDRMKVTLKADRIDYFPGEDATINVDAVTLFGPPAAGRRVSGKIEIEPFAFTVPEYRSFWFSDETKSFEKQASALADTSLDRDGHIGYRFTIPKDVHPASMLRGVISTTVLEPGGRGVTAYGGLMIHPYRYYVGLRQAQEGYGKPNAPTKFEFVSTDQAGRPAAGRNIEVTLSRIYWQSILKYDQRRGYHRYVSEQVESQVDKFAVVSIAGKSSFDVVPDDYGRYRVVARDVQSGATASLTFYSSGWGYSPWAMDNPERIEIDLDKESYQPGEIATVQVRAPFGGKLLLSVEREKVFSHQVVTMKDNTATIKVPVGNELKPNAYISAHIIRSTDKLERDTPVRAFGVAPITVSAESNRLAISLEVPAEMKPNSELMVSYKISGLNKGSAYVTIAAVDEGICQLTDLKTPDPHGFFLGKKRLSVETYDVYSVILPEIALRTSPAGDIEAARRRQLTPVALTRVRPVAFWSGLVRSGADGSGSVRFAVPQFNGQLRVMAVAFAKEKFGNAEKNIFVREPLVLTPTYPRFVAANDELTIPVSVYNGTGSDGVFSVKLEAGGPISVLSNSTQSVKVEAGRELPVYFQVRAGDATGVIKFTLTANGNGARSNATEEVPLRPAVPFITRGGMGSVTQSAPARFALPGEFVKGTTDYSLTVSAFPVVQFVGSLQYLLAYPHGCVEQTVSRLFPMLYFDELARVAEPELFKKSSVDYYIEEGISKLANMQLTSGAFSYWPQGNYQNNWASVYAAHFLVEARKSGYVIPDRVYDRSIGALQSYARAYPSSGRPVSEYENRDRYEYFRDSDQTRWETSVYANYVLALAGKADKSTLSYLRNNSLAKLELYSQYQLAGALALSGDVSGAHTLLPKTMAPTDSNYRWESGGSFSSPIRAQAIMLDILAEIDPSSPLVIKLVTSLVKAANDGGRWYTTQENAFALLALGKVFKQQGSSNYTGTVRVDGVTIGSLTPDTHNFKGKDWGDKKVEINLNGTGTAYFFWRVDGLPATQKVEEYDHDIQVRRRYLDEEGNAIRFDQFRQGDMVIAEISIKALTEAVQNVAIADLLPAGFEIENPRLQSRRGIGWIGDKMYQPRYMDIRDDRMVIYGDFQPNKEEKFYYGIRVVSAGTFVVPPVRAEAMYAPMISSVASSGMAEVKR